VVRGGTGLRFRMENMWDSLASLNAGLLWVEAERDGLGIGAGRRLALRHS
jgi:hypothetical protein